MTKEEADKTAEADGRVADLFLFGFSLVFACTIGGCP